MDTNLKSLAYRGLPTPNQVFERDISKDQSQLN
jgi:hypothetical protein